MKKIEARLIESNLTHQIRHTVLWPHKKQERCSIHEDLLEETFHVGVFSDNELASIGTFIKTNNDITLLILVDVEKQMIYRYTMKKIDGNFVEWKNMTVTEIQRFGDEVWENIIESQKPLNKEMPNELCEGNLCGPF